RDRRRPAAAVRAHVPRRSLAQPRQRRAWPGTRDLPEYRRRTSRRDGGAAFAAGRAVAAHHAAGRHGGAADMNNGADILIVEDEPKIANLLADYVRAAGHSARVIGDGREVVDDVRRKTPDAILLDLMLPGKDGIEICREIRTFSQVPIIMVTARVEEVDRLLGLELGADDYICKPFSPREVVARLKAVLRRAQPGPAAATEQGPLRVDAERFE